VLPGRPEEDTLQVVAVVETEAVLDRTAVRPAPLSRFVNLTKLFLTLIAKIFNGGAA
jgi:hypothetical protein